MTQPSATSSTGAQLVPVTVPPIEVGFSFDSSPCLRADDSAEVTHSHEHLAIVRYVTELRTKHEHKRIGHIRFFVLTKSQMEIVSPGEMERQARLYDEMHLGSKLTGYVVYIEEVVLEQSARGNDIGLAALYEAITNLHLPLNVTILLLEAGAIGPACSYEEAAEKLEKHWSRLGSQAWSYTDTSWVCVQLADFTRRPPADVRRGEPRLHTDRVLASQKDDGWS
ncbi:hypothetical protein Slin15195_G056180 [Septoria linicola]|uniref:Uncharacterized protein n=1 Tax=Septoria linicola TaxID=215465 RepID=A0A9Q9APX1_9PEZI|nr:hypothetical protein Slin14017_G072060 [Septoria linicola]USW52299.1 hypothetical protein Slin15195_G056180 [Septoria linicola]